jgi:hypothetical protein
MNRKRAFSAISVLPRGIACAAYLQYASAQSLGRLDLAKNSRFISDIVINIITPLAVGAFSTSGGFLFAGVLQ